MLSITIRSNRLLPSSLWGGQYLLFTVIREGLSAEDEARVIDHERVHVRQFWVLGITAITLLAPFIGWWALLGLFAHNGLYYWVRSYRKWTEIKAFVSSDILRHGKSVEWCARLLYRDYDLGERKTILVKEIQDKLNRIQFK